MGMSINATRAAALTLDRTHLNRKLAVVVVTSLAIAILSAVGSRVTSEEKTMGTVRLGGEPHACGGHQLNNA